MADQKISRTHITNIVQKLASPCTSGLKPLNAQARYLGALFQLAKSVIKPTMWKSCVKIVFDQSNGVSAVVDSIHNTFTLHFDDAANENIGNNAKSFVVFELPFTSLSSLDNGLCAIIMTKHCFEWIQYRYNVTSDQVMKKLIRCMKVADLHDKIKGMRFSAQLVINNVHLMAITADDEVLTCAMCGKDDNVSKCKRCMTVAFCSKECQKLHWDAGHKAECKPKDFYQKSLVMATTYPTFMSEYNF